MHLHDKVAALNIHETPNITAPDQNKLAELKKPFICPMTQYQPNATQFQSIKDCFPLDTGPHIYSLPLPNNARITGVISALSLLGLPA